MDRQSNQQALLVLYRRGYRKAISVMLGLILLAVIELLLIAYFVFSKPKPQYYAVHDNGTLAAIKPSQQPNFGSSALTQWEK